MSFDKTKFATTIKLLALRVPKKLCSTFIKAFKNKQVLFTKPGIRTIIDDVTEEAKAQGTKLMLLDEKVSNLQQLPAKLQDLTRDNNIVTIEHSMKLNFRQVSTDTILRSFLPASVPVPSSFETVGHIAHLNLKEEHEPYKHLIGEVFLEKNPGIRTVVTKVGITSNEFRVFEMEVIAGENDFETTLKEHACTFKFNFREVYWNSRLQTEHNRMVMALPEDAVVCDMMCGVGPFAVPAGARGCQVYANDLNPQSYRYLVDNVKINKVGDKVTSYNMDARDFVKHVYALQEKGEQPAFDHVIMNLPALSIEFLDVFVGLYKQGAPLPRMHVYCFSNKEDRVTDVLDRVAKVLGGPVSDAEVRDVRHVAPKKDYMYCSFVLPAEVAYNKEGANTSSSKRKADDESKEAEDCKKAKN
jgi:tRNA (guanine37-N1)-methyltransferase